MMNRRLIYALAGMIALSSFSTGCGDEDEPLQSFECGDHTVLHDGQCVAEAHDCDDDKVVTPRGECIEPDLFCGPGAQYDAAAEACLSSADISCGEGTVEEDGRCVLADPLHCGPGTVLADSECVLADDVCGSGTELDAPYCVPTEDICTDGTELDVESGACVDLGSFECGDGTVEHDNRCIPSLTVADDLAAQADIDHSDGAPIVASPDEAFVFSGTMDDELSHSFDLQGTEGQWIELTIYSRGLPSPGFEIRHDFGNWQRSVTAGMASQPSRVFALPADDTFELTVTTALADDDNASSFGDESWEYVGTVEVIDPPTAKEWDALEDTLEGSLDDPTENLFEVSVSEMHEILLTPSKLGVDTVNPTVEVWSTAGSFESRHSLEAGTQISIDTSGASTLHFHFDAVEVLGSRSDFEVNASGTETLEPGDFYHQEVSADAGQIIFLSHRSNDADSLTGRVRKDNEILFERQVILADNRSSYTADQTKREFFRAPDDGTYTVEFQNTSDTAVTNFVSTSSVEDVPVFEVPAQGSASFEASMEVDQLIMGDWRFVVVDTPDAGVFDVTITAEQGSPRASVFDTDGNELVDVFGSLGVATPNFEAPAAGSYFVVSRPWSSFTPVDGSLDFEIEGQTVEVVEPGDIITETFEADTFDLLTGEISHFGEFGVQARLINPHGTVIFEEAVTSSGFELVELFPGPGHYTLEVENVGTEPIMGITVEATASTPTDVLAEDEGFSTDYERDSLEAGDREFVVLRAQSDFILDLSAIFGDDEEGALRLWDLTQRQVIAEFEDELRVDMEVEIRSQQTYVIEFEALSDLADGYSLFIDGDVIVFVDAFEEHDPSLAIPTNSTASSNLSISGCSEVTDVSIATNLPTGTASMIYIDLYAPNQGGDPIALRAGAFGTLSTVYPDETAPVESLDPLLGNSGNGVWSLEIENTSSFSAASLASWSVHLTCTN